MIFCFIFLQTIVLQPTSGASLFSFGSGETTTTKAPVNKTTIPSQVAKYVGVDGLYQQLKDVNENNLRNAVGTLFTVGTNTAGFGTNFLNEISKINKKLMETHMENQKRILDKLIETNQAARGTSQTLLNNTHNVIQDGVNDNIHQWDEMTDMWMTGAKNAYSSNGAGSSSINIKTSIG